jgi:two-component system response regulator AtoC
MQTNRLEGPIVQDDPNFAGGISPAIQNLENVIAEIAHTDIPVLLVGESGTGKEIFARRVHRLSAHGERPLLRISCASMSLAMLSRELGLNPDVRSDTAEGAGGTVFLDEISELDAACQRDLLYALPDGDTGARRGKLTLRVVSTTSRNLDEEMRAGRFRSELYYRINGVCLRLPPLRERKEDIPLLVELFLTKHATQLGRPRPSLSPRTLQVLLDHSWPGNIRELENVVRKIVALADEQLATAELSATARETRKIEAIARYSYSLKAAARAASREAERELILKALARTRWNRKRAAQELQISYKSLLYKLKQIGFEDAEAN